MIEFILILFVITRIQTFTKMSDTDVCYESQIVEGQKIEWKHRQVIDRPFYFAEPHCLEESNFYNLRDCLSGEFIDGPPECFKLQSELNPCPNAFRNIGDKCCSFLPQVSHKKSPCPFHYEEEGWASNEPVWYPAERNLDYGIGEFVHTGGINFGKPVDHLTYEYKIKDSNCVIIRRGKYEAVPCDSLQVRICCYNFLHNTEERYCPPGCMRTTFEANLKCFCKAAITSECKLAKFPHEYQSLGVSKLIPNCKIGLKHNYIALSWESNQELNYTHWTYDTNWDVPRSFQSFILTSEGWKGQKDSDIKCKICEINHDYEHPSIKITTNNEGDTLVVTATNINSFAYFNEGYCFCFSNMFQSRTYQLLSIKCNETNTILQISSSGHYWCEGFEIKQFKKIVSNKVLVITENIYILEVTFSYKHGEDPTNSAVAWVYIITIQEVMEAFDQTVVVKWMKTPAIDESEKHVTYLIHICKPINKAKYLYDYSVIKRILDQNIIHIIHLKFASQLKNSEYCFETISNNNGIILTWNLTPKNTFTTPKELCFQDNGKIVTRYCSYDFYEGTKWENISSKTCRIFEDQSKITEELQELLNTENTTEVLAKLIFLSQDINSFEPVDISIVSNILEKVNPTESFIENITEIISNIMNANRSVLETSQIELNSTDRILAIFDEFLIKKKPTIKKALATSRNLITFIFDAKSDYAGLALTTNDIIELRKNITRENIAKIVNIEVATYMPDNLLRELSQYEDSKIVINIYLSNSLFNSEFKIEVGAKSFGIILPVTNISYKIPLFYKTALNSACGFWNYGHKNGDDLKGKWTLDGFSNTLGLNLVFCEFSHVTHFGLLITHFLKESIYLELITNIGCGMSLFGFLAIFLYALILKNWIYNKGNQILLQYCIVSSVQILLLFLSNTEIKRKKTVCITIGAILHYTVLAQFSWMLIFAVLQYKRYVQVIHRPILWVTTKFYSVCYIVPALPVAILLATDRQNYIHDEFCYPTKQGLLFTVLIPVGIIITINIFVFLRIIIQLFCSKGQLRNAITVDKEFYLKIWVVFLMFFMLGVTWTFGLIAEFFKSKVSLYIFCITASIQGFIIFLFFIVLNGNCKKMCNYIKSRNKNNH